MTPMSNRLEGSDTVTCLSVLLYCTYVYYRTFRKSFIELLTSVAVATRFEGMISDWLKILPP